jgi:hypothetical protein
MQFWPPTLLDASGKLSLFCQSKRTSPSPSLSSNSFVALGNNGDFHMEDCHLLGNFTERTGFVTCDDPLGRSCCLDDLIIYFHAVALFLYQCFWYDVWAVSASSDSY